MEQMTEVMTVENIQNKVYVIRGQQVMLDYDLAEIYGYEVKNLNQQVKRNIARFPEDFALVFFDKMYDIINEAEKEKIYEEITKELLERLGIQPTDVFIVIQEPPNENGGLAGKQREG